LHSEEANIGKEIDELVDEWIPEPLVPPRTAAEEAESEKTPVIVGYVVFLCLMMTRNVSEEEDLT
jgi:hypothetical protein